MANKRKAAPSLIIAEGQLIKVDKPPTKQEYNKCQSNYWFDSQKNIIYFREGQKKEKSIQLSANNGKYQYEGVISDNIYEIIIRTSIFSTIFGSSSDSHVAVTEESLKLPFEQQPWFVGIVEKDELKTIEQAQSHTFFTRAKGFKVYLHWTKTKNIKHQERPILLESNDLSLVLPRGEFVLARHNGGSARYGKYLAFGHLIIEGKLNEAQQMRGVFQSNLVLFKPNIISHYIEQTPREAINEELIMWLLDNGTRADCSDSGIINTAASKCSDRVIEALLSHGVKNSQQVLERAIARNIPPERMRIYFKTYRQCVDALTYIKHIKDYKHYDYTNRVLITLAWRYGNEDNFLRMLPKELIQHIISFGIDDDWPWLEYVEPANLSRNIYSSLLYGAWSFGGLVKLAITTHCYWNKLVLENETKIDLIMKLLFNNGQTASFYDKLSPSQMNLLTSWIIKLATRRPIAKEMFLSSRLLSYLLYYTSSTPIVKSLLDTRTIKREWWLEPANFTLLKNSPSIPLSWWAVRPSQPHKSLIQLLIRENLLPDECTLDRQVVGLSAYLTRYYNNVLEIEAMIEFIQLCRQNRNERT
eukprot:TRINITY_DN3522_c0_g1_i2.p1 TRINITY_DN3522_c0_g1~~TRINITY_DN3522_c0_g1_i2.p1  ORF type:complete len:586 (+),score=77.15 TRINITY_DN3522_c0_g1_i2:76-1833(+)